MKATELLERQHREIEQIFDMLHKDEGDRTENLRELASKLAAHMRIEEEIFYPRAREIVEGQILESLEEHTLAAFALKRIAEIDPDHESFSAKLKALEDLMLHHIEEEENEMFPRIEGAIGDRELAEMGEALETRFADVIESGYGANLVRGRAKKNGAGRPRQVHAMR